MPNKLVKPSDISISDLPFDLLCFPLMLMLLSVLSLGYALFVLFGLISLILLRYLYRGRLQRMWVSFLTFAFQLGIWAGLAYLSQSLEQSRLLLQVLWIVSFLLVDAVVLLLMRRQRFPKENRAKCCCDKRRSETIIAEQIRFDNTLTRFCVLALLLCLPFVFLRSSLAVGGSVILSYLLSLLSLGLIVVELYHIAWLRRYLKHENWLPVFDEHNQIVGRVPRSDATSAEGALALVRLLAISGDMIYLEYLERDESSYYDTPFSDWLSEDDTPASVAQRMIDARFCGLRRAKPRYLFPYRIEVEGRPYLVHLMTVDIEEATQLYIDCCPVEGKWWSVEHLGLMLGQRDVSPYLTSEYAALEHTVFLAQRLRRTQ